MFSEQVFLGQNIRKFFMEKFSGLRPESALGGCKLYYLGQQNSR